MKKPHIKKLESLTGKSEGWITKNFIPISRTNLDSKFLREDDILLSATVTDDGKIPFWAGFSLFTNFRLYDGPIINYTSPLRKINKRKDIVVYDVYHASTVTPSRTKMLLWKDRDTAIFGLNPIVGKIDVRRNLTVGSAVSSLFLLVRDKDEGFMNWDKLPWSDSK